MKQPMLRIMYGDKYDSTLPITIMKWNERGWCWVVGVDYVETGRTLCFYLDADGIYTTDLRHMTGTIIW